MKKGKSLTCGELDQALSEIEHFSGRGPFWLYGKAIRTLVQSKNTDPKLLSEARSYLQEALELRKDWSAAAVLAGKICELQDEPDRAVEYYMRAVFIMGERDSDVIRRTVQLLLPRGYIDEAGQLFAYLEKQKSPLVGEMNQQLVEVRVFRGEIAEAAKDLEKSVPADSKNYRDFLYQGFLYGHLAERLRLKAVADGRDWRSDPEVIQMAQQAVNALLKASKLNPQADDVWIALVRIVVDMGQPEKAQFVIAEAERSLKGELAPITLARCYELLNQQDMAQAKYEAAAKASPQNSRVLRQAATFYLRAASSTAPSRFCGRSSICNHRQRLTMPAGPAAAWQAS